ncbi:MAG: hypothetical protein WCH21_05330 [Bacteroidota bacterium]
MENLIEQTYEIDQNCYSVAPDGTKIDYFRTISVKIEDGEHTIYYTFSRYRHDLHRSYISMEKRDTWSTVKSYWKFYEDNTKFENAIKRIQKLKNLEIN